MNDLKYVVRLFPKAIRARYVRIGLTETYEMDISFVRVFEH